MRTALRTLTLSYVVLAAVLGSDDVCDSLAGDLGGGTAAASCGTGGVVAAAAGEDGDDQGGRSVVVKLRASKDVWHRSQYFGPVEIGSPPKEFLLMVDTGSFDVSVQGHTCTSCHSGNSYGLCSDSATAAACAATVDSARGEGRSLTGRHLLCNESHRCSNLGTKCNPAASDEARFCKYDIEFADHSTMEGRWMSDVITFHDARDAAREGADSDGGNGSRRRRRSLVVTHRFAELSNMGFIFKFGLFDGVLGLAPHSSSLQSILHAEGKIDQNEYTVCFYRDGGYLVLGRPTRFVLTGGRHYNYLQHLSADPWHPGFVPQPDFGLYAWTPIVKDAHARIYTHGVAVGQYQVNVPPSNFNDRVHTVLDSGSVLTYMEDTALADLHRQLTSHCQQGANPVCEKATKGDEGFPKECAYATDPGGEGDGRCGATWRWWNKGPYKILCFAAEEGVPRWQHLRRMPWLHFVFLGVTVSVPPVQYLIEEYKIGKCVGLRSVGAGVKGMVLGSVMFNGLSIAHDFSGHRLGWAMSTCAHDPDSSNDHAPDPPGGGDGNGDGVNVEVDVDVFADDMDAKAGGPRGEDAADVWARDPLEGGPDLLDSRPHVLQNRYFSDGHVEQVADACFGISSCKRHPRHHRDPSFLQNPLSMPPDLKLTSIPNLKQFVN